MTSATATTKMTCRSCQFVSRAPVIQCPACGVESTEEQWGDVDLATLDRGVLYSLVDKRVQGKHGYEPTALAERARAALDRLEAVENACEITAKRAEMCPHMLALIEHCLSVGVTFGGCGDCGSPWLTCAECKLEVGDASKAFPKEQ